MVRHHGTEDNTLGQTIVKPTALGPVANTDTKLLIYGLFQKGRVLAQDGGNSYIWYTDLVVHPDRQLSSFRLTTYSPSYSVKSLVGSPSINTPWRSGVFGAARADPNLIGLRSAGTMPA